MFLRNASAVLSANSDAINFRKIVLLQAAVVSAVILALFTPCACPQDFSNARATYASPRPDLSRLNFSDMREIETTLLTGPRSLTDCHTCRDSQSVTPITAPAPVPPATPSRKRPNPKAIIPAAKPARATAKNKVRKSTRRRSYKRRVTRHKPPASVRKKKILTGTISKTEKAVTAPAVAPPRPTALSEAPATAGGIPVINNLGMDPITYALFQSHRMLRKGRFYCAGLRAREALYLDPTNQQARNLLNTTLHTVGIHPLAASDRLALANHFAGQNMILPAVIEYRESIALNPTAEAYAGLGELLMFTGQAEKAGEMFEDALALNPNYSAARSGLMELARPQFQPVSGINTSQTVLDTPTPYNSTVPPMVVPRNPVLFQTSNDSWQTAGAGRLLEPVANVFNITPYGSNIISRIAMRNYHLKPIALPDKAEAMVQSPDGTSRTFPVYFQSRTVPPKGRVFGTFITPGYSIPPGAKMSLASWLPDERSTDIPVRLPVAYDIDRKLTSINSTSCDCK